MVKAEAAMISEELAVSGSWWKAKAREAVIAVAMARRQMSIPIKRVETFSIL